MTCFNAWFWNKHKYKTLTIAKEIYDSDTKGNQAQWQKIHLDLPKQDNRWQCNHCRENRT